MKINTRKENQGLFFWEHVYIFLAILSLFAFFFFLRKRKMLRAYVQHLQIGPSCLNCDSSSLIFPLPKLNFHAVYLNT